MLKQENKICSNVSTPQQVADSWDSMWTRNCEQIKRKISKRSFIKNFFIRKESLTYIVNDVFVKEIKDFHGKCMLEAGSGTGLLSLEMAGKKAKVTLLDISNAAVSMSKYLFAENNKQAYFINGDMFNLPIRESSYDVVWNVGVIEHFIFDGQIKILKEMTRACKRGGLIITINPSGHRSLYTFFKTFSEKMSLWTIGYEEPIASLREQASNVAGVSLLKEYRMGFFYQTKFMHYLFYKTKILQRMVSMSTEYLNRIFTVFNRLPGCFLVTIIRKN